MCDFPVEKIIENITRVLLDLKVINCGFNRNDCIMVSVGLYW